MRGDGRNGGPHLRVAEDGEGGRPRRLRESDIAARPDVADIVAGFALTGYFLARHVFEPRGLDPSDARAAYLALLQRSAMQAEAAE